MRRKDRELTIEKTKEILTDGNYGILSTVGEDAFPYGVPLSYVYENEQILFHCVKETGKKLDGMRYNEKVCFTVVGATKVLPDKFATNYESVIVQGRVKFLTGKEKYDALYALVKKYSPEYLDEGRAYIEKATDAVDVGAIIIESMTGKARY